MIISNKVFPIEIWTILKINLKKKAFSGLKFNAKLVKYKQPGKTDGWLLINFVI